ncbi:hypothetical protein BDN72DRAFT_902886 [Pluteus cervinus]|uniref:Uncharacterized protein n=1 Tax=Pluteus cervinus TaxID=181527 RepID=A0ACD3AC03_9AGAR|nr:hypothetical protein BDN72DRAFT_902886 [Pluteus cervinus]
MPAERTRGSRRTDADGSQLVWTMPVEPVDSSGIAFTTAMTPITFTSNAGAAFNSTPPSSSLPDSTFDDMPPLVDAPPLSSEFILFPPAEESNLSAAAARKQAHSKKKPENHIPRPPNAFILFRSSFIKSQHVSTEVETNHSTLSKIIGLTWQNLPEDERKVWHAKAKNALEDHKRKYPKYAFRPLHNRGRNTSAGTCGPGGGLEGKRKVREVEPKDMKRCAKIAELLISGKKGAELDAAIQEFDKTHVPEIVTRFEAPITAQQYHHTSNAPSQQPGYIHQTTKGDKPATKKRRVASVKPSRSSTPEETTFSVSTPVFDGVANTVEEQTKFNGPVFDFTSFAFDPSTEFNCSTPSTNSIPSTPHLQVDTSFIHDSTLPWSTPPMYSAASPASSISEIHTPGLEYASFDHDALYTKYPSTPNDDVFNSVFAQQQGVDFNGNTGITPGMEYAPDMGIAVGAAGGLAGHNPDHHHHSHIDPYLSLSHSAPEYHQFDQMAAVLGAMPCGTNTTSSTSTTTTTGLYDIVSPTPSHPSCHGLDLDFSLWVPGMTQTAF